MQDNEETKLSKDVLIKQYTQSIMVLETQKKGIQEDIKQEYADAKSVGLEPKVLRAVVKLLKTPKAEQQELDAKVQQYLYAVEKPEQEESKAVSEEDGN